MRPANETLLKSIPAVESLLQDERLRTVVAETAPRRIVVDAVRAAVQETRTILQNDTFPEPTETSIREAILTRALKIIRSSAGPHYRKVINATGIILHTGLGRAVLPPRALAQIQNELAGYSLLQLDARTGKRSVRDQRIEWLLKQLTDAEAATVVNNNAAGTMIVLNTVGSGKEVIVSRGQLVEIGGSFRLPDVMAASGARMVEVGTTNKTHPADYENAVTENTAAIMRVHPSNYRIHGFSSEVPLKELERIAHANGLVLIDDLGAGPLIDFSRFGFEREPLLRESVAVGADLVISSADKLIGGCQGGIILGRTELIERIRKNPLARIVRVDKLALAALEATLTCFLDESIALEEIPTLRMLMRPAAELAGQARRIVRAIRKHVPNASARTVDGFSQMGSGSLPEQNLPTSLVAVEPADMTAQQLAAALRSGEPPIFARIQNDTLLLDPRTLQRDEEKTVIPALVDILSQAPAHENQTD